MSEMNQDNSGSLKSVEEINSLIPIMTCSDLEKVKEELKEKL